MLQPTQEAIQEKKQWLYSGSNRKKKHLRPPSDGLVSYNNSAKVLDACFAHVDELGAESGGAAEDSGAADESQLRLKENRDIRDSVDSLMRTEIDGPFVGFLEDPDYAPLRVQVLEILQNKFGFERPRSNAQVASSLCASTSHHGSFANILLDFVSRAHKFVSGLSGCMCYNLVIQIVTGGGKTVIPLIILEYFHAHLSKEGEDGSRAIEANTIITPVESFEASWDQGKYGSHAQKSACALQLIVTRPQLAALRVTQTATVTVTVSRTSALLSRRMPRSMGKFWSTRSIHATGSAWQTRSGFKAPVMQPISSVFVWLFMRVIPRDLATKFGVSSPAPAFFVLECLGNLQWPQPNQIGASISFM